LHAWEVREILTQFGNNSLEERIRWHDMGVDETIIVSGSKVNMIEGLLRVVTSGFF
jgi:hypothetical protein